MFVNLKRSRSWITKFRKNWYALPATTACNWWLIKQNWWVGLWV